MAMTLTRCIEVRDLPAAGEARRWAGDVARRLGLDAAAAGRAATVASEMGTNLVKHAGGGELFVRGAAAGGAVELLAIDRGPGIADLGHAVGDGCSTVGSLGQGLGAIARASSTFDAYSVPGAGTVVFAAVGGGTGPGDRRVVDVGAVCAAKPGQDVSGDAYAAVVEPARDRCLVMVADGLGHGLAAADAALAAVRTFHAVAAQAPGDVVSAIHAGLRATRGAAVSVAEVDRRRSVVRFAGVGNVAATIVHDGAVRHLVTHHGTAGHQVRQVVEFAYAWPAGARLVLHSDGITTRWALDRYPALAAHHPAVVAGVLYRDFARRTDDATVVVVGDAV